VSGLVSSSNKLEQAAPPAAWRYPRLIAHRGGGVLAPENTLAALRMAATRGYRAVEFDVMLSADGTPMLIHDETLERTSSGRGAVAETSDATLVTLDAGSWFGGSFAGEPLPRFLDAGRLCVSTGLWANVEIKPRQEPTMPPAARPRDSLPSCGPMRHCRHCYPHFPRSPWRRRARPRRICRAVCSTTRRRKIA